MAVKIRLMRMGKKKQPTYRVVAADSRSPRDGRFIEAVGVYAPRGRSSTDRDAIVQLDETKVLRWLSNGAKPTERVERILQQVGTLDRFRNGEAPRLEPVGTGTAPGTAAAAPSAAAAQPATAPAPVAAEDPEVADTAAGPSDEAAPAPTPTTPIGAGTGDGSEIAGAQQ